MPPPETTTTRPSSLSSSMSKSIGIWVVAERSCRAGSSTAGHPEGRAGRLRTSARSPGVVCPLRRRGGRQPPSRRASARSAQAANGPAREVRRGSRRHVVEAVEPAEHVAVAHSPSVTSRSSPVTVDPAPARRTGVGRRQGRERDVRGAAAARSAGPRSRCSATSGITSWRDPGQDQEDQRDDQRRRAMASKGSQPRSRDRLAQRMAESGRAEPARPGDRRRRDDDRHLRRRRVRLVRGRQGADDPRGRIDRLHGVRARRAGAVGTRRPEDAFGADRLRHLQRHGDAEPPALAAGAARSARSSPPGRRTTCGSSAGSRPTSATPTRTGCTWRPTTTTRRSSRASG